MHAHPSLKVWLLRRLLTAGFGARHVFNVLGLRTDPGFNPLSVRTAFGKLKEGGLDVLLSTTYTPEREIIKHCWYLKALQFVMPFTYKEIFGQDYFELTCHILDLMEEQVRHAVQDGKSLAQMAFSYQELEEILSQDPADRPIAVIHNVEGAHSLDGKLENVKRLHDRGVAYLTLAHFYENPAVSPVFPYPESVQKLGCFPYSCDLTRGLTEFGEKVVEAMIDLGMILDISHCTPPARERIYQIVGNRAPLIASHVGAYEINPSPYNLKDWEIEKIADTGGLVAVIFMNYWLMPHETRQGLNFITRTIEHLVQVGGIDHVGIGTDFDGFTDPPDDLKDASQLPRLTQRLLAEGYSREEVEKIWGGNALSVLKRGWGRKGAQ